MQKKLDCGAAAAARAAFATAGVMGAVAAAYAQSSGTPANPEPTHVRVQTGKSRTVPTLADVLDTLNWDPQTRGPLLIVSPEETVAALIEHQEGGVTYSTPAPPMEPDASGRYRISQITDYFDRRLVAMHSLSVLAPRKMTVLNTARLPKPNAYAGMEEGEAFKLLVSTLTPGQWRTLASPGGIGASDLNRDQTELFLAMLPDPVRVSAVTPSVAADGTRRFVQQPPATLTPDQRAGMRLSLNKTIDWTFLTHTRGDLGIGSGEPSSGATYRVLQSDARFQPRKEAYGVSLSDEVDARSKPSQLPYDWSALDVSLSLDQVKTVGELVRMIASKTGAELYCDPRYRDRTVMFRGVSASAGDTLHAIAWAVTGTWRRLGSAFVLTDDIEGLGVRHAVIGNWLQQNALLAETRERSVDRMLADGHVRDYLGWSDSDPLKPNDALRHKIDDSEKESAADSGSNGRAHPLEVPMTDLPQAAQALAQRQVDGYAKGAGSTSTFMPPTSEVRTDAVHVTMRVHAAYSIPGLGTADATAINDKAIGDALLGRPQPGSPGRAAARETDSASMPPPAVAFPSDSKVRALVVTPLTGDAVEAVAEAAHARGFSELWVQVPRGETELLASAVRTGVKYGLAIRPVLRVLSADPKDKPEWLDRNLLGETVSTHANWWRDRLLSLGLPAELPGVAEAPSPFAWITNFATLWPDLPAENALVRNGDYLRCDDPDVESKIIEDISKDAAVPGIAGIVLRNMTASGYSTMPSAMGVNRARDSTTGRDPLLQMGYTDTMRLAFLRDNGTDPTDLSPLLMGGHVQIGAPFGKQIDLGLPFFRESGASAESNNDNGRGSSSNTAGDSAKKWRAYRETVHTNFLTHVYDALTAKFPGLPIVIRRQHDPVVAEPLYFGSFERPAPTVDPKAAAQAAAAPIPSPTRERRTPREEAAQSARAASKIVYYPIVLPADPSAAATAHYLERLPYELRYAVGCDGVVIDLSAASVPDALAVLAAIPAPPAARP